MRRRLHCAGRTVVPRVPLGAGDLLTSAWQGERVLGEGAHVEMDST